MILWKEGATQAQEDEAQAILECLTTAYPNHPWGVRVYDGGFFIRHMAFEKNWGMNYRGSASVYSSSAMKRQIILLAGEWLERAGMRRGRGDPDQEIEHVEGVPPRDQPVPLTIDPPAPPWFENGAMKLFGPDGKPLDA